MEVKFLSDSIVKPETYFDVVPIFEEDEIRGVEKIAMML